jgi:hypothetical protein
VVLAVPDVVTFEVFAVPATPAILLDDYATVPVAGEHGLSPLLPIGRERFLAGRSLPSGHYAAVV